jgi:aminobenzoyl-glutamate utilization protein B
MTKHIRFILAILIMPQTFIMAVDNAALKQEVIAIADNLVEEIDAMSIRLWELSETALKEHRSSAYLTDILERNEFTVERGVAGMPTAFTASYGTGKPVIGILAEYDALPGVGNAAESKRTPREDGVTSGHGCGHNLFGAGSIGAAIALKRLIEGNKLKGTIKLFGTPAEETGIGKTYMARDGVFDGLDAVLEWHPSDSTEVGNQPGRALNSFEVEFFGQAAHAAADPWNGRSALDAVELMNYGVNLMREHIRESTRMHYVIVDGGDAPNVVPEYAKVWYFVRDTNRESVNNYYKRILNIAEGAALATNTTHKVRFITGLHEYLLNRPLQEALQANLRLVGTPKFTRQEQQFGKDLQAFLNIDQTGFHDAIKPLASQAGPVSGGSTDVAELSWMTPTAGVGIATAAMGIPWHSWATTACHGTSAGRKGAVVAAKVLAATGLELLTDKELLKSAKAYFKEASGGRAYQSPLPKNQKVILPGD